MDDDQPPSGPPSGKAGERLTLALREGDDLEYFSDEDDGKPFELANLADPGVLYNRALSVLQIPEDPNESVSAFLLRPIRMVAASEYWANLKSRARGFFEEHQGIHHFNSNHEELLFIPYMIDQWEREGAPNDWYYDNEESKEWETQNHYFTATLNVINFGDKWTLDDPEGPYFLRPCRTEGAAMLRSDYKHRVFEFFEKHQEYDPPTDRRVLAFMIDWWERDSTPHNRYYQTKDEAEDSLQRMSPEERQIHEEWKTSTYLFSLPATPEEENGHPVHYSHLSLFSEQW